MALSQAEKNKRHIEKTGLKRWELWVLPEVKARFLALASAQDVAIRDFLNDLMDNYCAGAAQAAAPTQAAVEALEPAPTQPPVEAPAKPVATEPPIDIAKRLLDRHPDKKSCSAQLNLELAQQYPGFKSGKTGDEYKAPRRIYEAVRYQLDELLKSKLAIDKSITNSNT